MTAWAGLLLGALVPFLVLGTSGQLTRDALRGARDAWLLALLAIGAAVASVHGEWWLTVMLLSAAGWWLRPPAWAADPVDLAPWTLRWLAIAATWVLARAVPLESWPLLLTVWGTGAWALAGLMLVQRCRGQRPAGWLGQRAVAGAAFALLLPLLPPAAWPGPLVGLWLSGPSWLAVLAVWVAAMMRWPAFAPWLVAALAIPVALVGPGWVGGRWGPLRRILAFTPRGPILVTALERVVLVRLALAEYAAAGPRVWLVGFGPGTAGPRTDHWALRYDHAQPVGNFHNEPVQLVYESGAVGALALVLFAWRIVPHLAWGDPWSAAAVAGLVCAGGLHIAHIAPLGLLWLFILARVTL